MKSAVATMRQAHRSVSACGASGKHEVLTNGGDHSLDTRDASTLAPVAPASVLMNNTAFVVAQRLSGALDGEQARQTLEAVNGSIKEE